MNTETPKKETKKKEKPIYVASLKHNDSILECLYDENTETTSFALYDGEQLTYTDRYSINNTLYKPLIAKSDLLKKGVILLPTKPIEYGSEEALVDEIQAFIHEYLDITPDFERIASYYVLFTWIYDRFHEVPYLRSIGDYGSGKTRFLRVIGSVCYKPIFTAGATTTSPIFRMLDQIHGTLVLDEADFRASDMTSDIIKILNSGYTKGFPVLRSEGKGVFEVKTYDVFSPKIVATRETFRDQALESRFLVEQMGGKKLRKDIPSSLGDEFYEEALLLRNKLLMWRLKNHSKPIDLGRHTVPDTLHPRLKQIVLPLLSIIGSKEMRDALTDFISSYNKDLVADRGMTWEAYILEAIVALKHYGNDDMTMGDIARQIRESIDIEEDPLTPRKVGWYVRTRLQVKTRKQRGGYTLSYTLNKDKIEMLCERYGVEIEPSDNDDVNDVNNVNIIKPLTEEEVRDSSPF
tara:strand:- start:1341 stop:2732 length:1392 start_codon:yes stop_codon:yes gene_type:complete